MGLLEALRDKQFRRDVGTNANQLAQSMSNTAASTVTAPVDALAWLLRKARVPVPESALGGSEWAKQAGLVADVPDGLPKVAGETLGLLAPMMGTKEGAAAVAKGLRQMGANAAAPTMLNKQAGAFKFPQDDALNERLMRVSQIAEEKRLPNLHQSVPKNYLPPQYGSEKVTLYRGVPSDIENAQIRPGDWVSLDKKYAASHGKGKTGKSKLVSMEVPADHVGWAGTSMDEFFYVPR